APAAWTNRLRVNPMISSWFSLRLVRRAFRCVGLLEWLRSIESVDPHAFGKNALDRRDALCRHVEVACGEDLADKADIGHRRRVAMAEAAGLALFRHVRFERLESQQRPMLQPAVAGSLVEVQVALEKFPDARHDERVRVAGDDQ